MNKRQSELGLSENPSTASTFPRRGVSTDHAQGNGSGLSRNQPRRFTDGVESAAQRARRTHPLHRFTRRAAETPTKHGHRKSRV